MDTLQLAEKLHSKLKDKFVMHNRQTLILKENVSDIIPGSGIKKSKTIIEAEEAKSFNNVYVVLSSEDSIKPFSRVFCSDGATAMKANNFYVPEMKEEMLNHTLFIVGNHYILSGNK